MTSKIKVDDIADTNVDDSEETLVPFLELLLVKDLDCNHGGIFDGAGGGGGSWDKKKDMVVEERTCQNSHSSRD